MSVHRTGNDGATENNRRYPGGVVNVTDRISIQKHQVSEFSRFDSTQSVELSEKQRPIVIQFGYILRANPGKPFYGRANATYAPGILSRDAGWSGVVCVEARAAAQKTTYCRPACS